MCLVFMFLACFNKLFNLKNIETKLCICFVAGESYLKLNNLIRELTPGEGEKYLLPGSCQGSPVVRALQ